MKQLGIDLGTASLGWAIIDDERMEGAATGSSSESPIECGVVVFPEGMDRDKSDNLSSPAAERRMKRASRRLIFRRKLRKFHMLRALMDAGMCPLSEEGFKQWKETKTYPIHDAPFMAWLASSPEQNPYRDRKRAAEEPVDKLTLGRALYHIAQRRGFKSSKKEQLQAFQAEEEAEGTTKKAKKTKKEPEATQTKQAIDDLSRALNGKTLGQFFYNCFEKGEKIRGRKTGRVEHYEKEFAVIAEQQHLSEELRRRFHDILFFQRPLRIQRHTVGWCTLEKGRPYAFKDPKTGEVSKKVGRKYRRCLVSHPKFERFRALCFLNNLYVSETRPERGTRIRKEEGRLLTPEECKKMLAKLTRKTPCAVENVLPKGMFCNYRLSDEAPILPVTAGFVKLDLTEDQWQKALNALVFYDDLTKLQAWATKAFNLTEKDAYSFARINPSTDRAQYSLHAILKILPYLERGFRLRKAVFCANLETVIPIPTFTVHKEEILQGLAECEVRYAAQKKDREQGLTLRVEPLEGGHYRTYLERCWNVTEDDFRKLYVDISETDIANPKLPPVDLASIRNPLACRSLTVLRRLINTLRESGKINYDTHIHLELAHTVNSSNMCRAIEKTQKEQATKRENARTELQRILREESSNREITDDLILRFLLWEEQGHYSVYTGQVISQKAMLEACDIEHTVPRSRGGTSRMENLTLCEQHYNRDIKKSLLPSECPNAESEYVDSSTGISYPALQLGSVLRKWQEQFAALDKQLIKPHRGTDPAVYAAARQKYLMNKMRCDYLSQKIATFSVTAEKVDSRGFIPRQMADTGLITRQALRLLKTRYTTVYPTNGAATAFARKAWGLQHEDEAKSRIDHTHHAVDACVIAALNVPRFNQICKALGDEQYGDYATVCPPPYPHFGEHIQNAMECILVRHLPTNRQTKPIYNRTCRIPAEVLARLRKEGKPLPVVQKTSAIRGSLHNDTLYGRIQQNGETFTVLRKTLAGAKRTDLEKWAKEAVDPEVGKRLAEQLANYVKQGVEETQLGLQTYWMRLPENGQAGIPIKKIRIKVGNPANPDPIRVQMFDAKQYVYGSNGDLLKLEFLNNKKGVPTPNCVSLLDEVKARQGTPSEKHPAFALQKGILALIYQDSPEELKKLSPKALASRLYLIRKFDDKGKITLWFHREARRSTILSAELKEEGKTEKGSSTLDFTHSERLLRVSVIY